MVSSQKYYIFSTSDYDFIFTIELFDLMLIAQ